MSESRAARRRRRGRRRLRRPLHELPPADDRPEIQVYEAGDEVGGTWYWNRYPGARCDVESMTTPSRSTQLEQEWAWTASTPSSPRSCATSNHVADRFDLRRDIQFDTRVTSADVGRRRLDAGVVDRPGRPGLGAVPHHRDRLPFRGKLPDIDGIDSFAGRVYHTGRWPHEGVDFSRQRVGVIGTGSSGSSPSR